MEEGLQGAPQGTPWHIKAEHRKSIKTSSWALGRGEGQVEEGPGTVSGWEAWAHLLKGARGGGGLKHHSLPRPTSLAD